MKNSVQYISPVNGSVINALLGDYRWAYEAGQTLTISYSFYDLDSPIFIDVTDGYQEDDPDYDFPFRAGFGAFSSGQQDLTRNLFRDIETIINVEFVEVVDGFESDIRLGLTDLGLENADGLAFTPTPHRYPFNIDPDNFLAPAELSGDIWVDTDVDDFYFTEVVVHEIGHALGLSHSFEDGFQEIDGVDLVILDGALDYNRYTVMAYDVWPDGVRSRDVLFTSTVATLMSLDVEALQFLYGPSLDEGDDVYVIDEYDGDFDLNSLDYPGYDLHQYINSYITLADSGGSNVLVLDLDGDLRIELDPGQWSGTEGGLLTRDFDDENLYLTPDSVLGELHFTGVGTHTVSLDGKNYSHYKFVESAAGITVVEIDGDLSVLIGGAEELVFADVTFDVSAIRSDISQRNQALLLSADGPLYQSTVEAGITDIPAVEAQLYRLYYGGLGRAPDQGGYDWWLQQVDGAIYDFAEVAARFIDSAEFRDLADVDGNGAISNTEFLDHMYFNVFGREPDEAGYAFWIGELGNGQFTQPSAFANMVQSDEFVILTAATVGDFIFL